MTENNCSHAGKRLILERYPLRWGTAGIEQCLVCGAWRILHPPESPQEWQYTNLAEEVERANSELRESVG
jgi:hypothetical protein